MVVTVSKDRPQMKKSTSLSFYEQGVAGGNDLCLRALILRSQFSSRIRLKFLVTTYCEMYICIYTHTVYIYSIQSMWDQSKEAS